MPSASIEWEDDSPADVAEALAGLDSILADELEAAANDIGARIAGEASGNAPVDTGRLSSDISHAVDAIGRTAFRIRVGSNLDYAGPQETGTSPFFPPPSELRDWARRNLGDEDAAFLVARSISESGIESEEYLASALDDNWSWALNRAQRAVTRTFDRAGFDS